jgi:TPR repeat protein
VDLEVKGALCRSGAEAGVYSKEALENCKSQAEAGDLDSIFYLALFYLQGGYGMRNETLGMTYLKLAAQRGHKEALDELISRLSFLSMTNSSPFISSEKEKWEKISFERAKSASENGSISNLGEYYYLGMGVGKNIFEARKWYSKEGDLEGLAASYCDVDDKDKKPKEALKILLKAAAEQQNSQYKWYLALATFYDDGNCINQDQKARDRYFELAAKAGGIEAIGDIHLLLQDLSDKSNQNSRNRLAKYWAERAYGINPAFGGELLFSDEPWGSLKMRSLSRESAIAGYELSLHAQLELAREDNQWKNICDWAELGFKSTKLAEFKKADFARELSECWAKGRGRQQNMREAQRWYRNAVERGYNSPPPWEN